MSKRSFSAVSRAAAIALAAGLVVVPQANAETKNNLDQPLACNLQLKDPGAIPFGQASGVEGVYNAANPQYSNFRVALNQTSAPDTVEQGEEFDYVIDAGKLGVPASIKAAVTANVSRVSQMNIWYQLPENAELVSFKQEGGLDGMKVEQVGNKLRIWTPAPTKGSKDVTQWSKDTRNQYAHGGAEATRGTSTYDIVIPKVTLRLKATGAPGSTIQAGFPKVDADSFSSELPIQFYADASAKVVFSSISANGFIRCGLSEDDKYWPRDKGGTNLPSEKFSAVKIVAPAKKNNDEHDPKAKGSVTITEGDALPEAKAQITDFDKLPAGTTAAWASEHKTAGANQQGKITVTYPDKSTDTVAVTVNVNKKATAADQNDPKAKGPVTITQGDALPKAEDQIADFANLPAGTKAAWTSTHDKVGANQDGTITVTYADGSTDTVAVTVTVNKKETLADKNDPKAKGAVTITQGDALPKAEDQIADFANLPAGTKAAWTSTHDKVGDNQNGAITVTYSDGSTDTVNLPVTVEAPFEARAKVNPTTVQVGDQIADDAAKAQIANAASAPAGTTFVWKTRPDTTAAAEGVEGVVTVTVPGKEPKDVTVTYNVQAEPVSWMPEVDETIESVEVGEEVKAPEEFITNKADAPTGTTYEWATKPDTSSAGEKTGTINVTADGKTYPRNVKVNVVAGYAPQAKAEATEVQIGTEITDADAKAQIANAGEAPFGTKFEWAEKPKTDSVGTQTGKVKVTVEGKDSVEVDVTYNVVSSYVPAAKTEATEVEQDATISDEDAKAQIANAADAPAGTTFTWKTKPDTAAAGEKTGVVTVTVPGAEAKDIEVKFTVKAKNDDTDTPEQPENPQPGEFAPKAKETATEVEQNATITDEDAKAQIANAADAPAGTTFAWKTKPDTSKEGETTGVVTVQEPNRDPIEVTVHYVVAEKKTDEPNPEQPQPNPNPTEGTTLEIKADGIVLPQTLTLKDTNGNPVEVIKDANGVYQLPANLANKQTIVVKDAKGKDVTYTIDLENNTYKKKMSGLQIGATVAGSLLGAAGLFGSALQVPGLAGLNTEIQKQIGIFNPQLAGMVAKAMPVISAILGVTGIGLIIGALVPKKDDKGNETILVGNTQLTKKGAGSSTK